MVVYKSSLSFCVFLFALQHANSMDPLSAFVAISAAASKRMGKLVCSTGLMECCNREHVKLDIEGLSKELIRQLHGQHIVTSTVLNAVRSHARDRSPTKPLVMSFHGWTGVGKSFASRIITRNLYKLGGESSFVHNFYSDVHFKNPEKIEEYKEQLHSWIYHNVSRCDRSLFIFDEMDHMPEGWIDVLVPFLGHNTNVDGVDFRKTIFIFLSVIGGDRVTELTMRHLESGGRREDLRLSDFQNVLQMTSYNQVSGLKNSRIIERELIDLFVPFLPLGKEQVRSCIEDELYRRNLTIPDSADVEAVMRELQWFPSDSELFSKSGCKKVTHKVSHTFG